MIELAGPLARVLLRYVGAAIMTKAGIAIDVTDPDLATLLEFLLGGAISVGTESWWYLARRYGWCQ